MTFVSVRVRKIKMLALVLSICCYIVPARGLEIREVAQVAKQSTYLVVNFDIADNIQGQGTGFVLGKERLFVTNFHVIEGAESVGILIPGESTSKLAALIAYDRAADIAVYRLARDMSRVPYLNLYGDEPEVGEEVVVFGHPQASLLGIEPTLSTGIVSSIRLSLEDYGPVIQITAAISPGSSGSPVMTKNGQVVGIATSSFIDGQSINIAIPASTLDRVIRRSLPNAILNDIVGKEMDYPTTSPVRIQPKDVSPHSPSGMGPVLTSEEEPSTSFQTQKLLARSNQFYGLFALVVVCLGIVTFVFYRYYTKNAVGSVGWELVVSPSGRRVLISKTTMLVGRDSSCNILLQGDYVSQRHAELSIRRGELWLKDLNSKNGTKVNGQRVEAHRLKAGDVVDIAGNVFRVEKLG